MRRWWKGMCGAVLVLGMLCWNGGICSAGAKNDVTAPVTKEAILGTWEWLHGPVTITFAKDCVVTFVVNQQTTIRGVYSLHGDELTTTTWWKGKEAVSVLTVSRPCDGVLVLTNKHKATLTLRKVR